jgi:hypothetical protein
MLSFEKIKEKNIALVVWNAEKDDDAHVYLGKIVHSENVYSFRNESRKWNLPLNEQDLDKLKQVPQDLKISLLNADFYFSMSIGSIPDNSKEKFIPTGMQWHKE